MNGGGESLTEETSISLSRNQSFQFFGTRDPERKFTGQTGKSETKNLENLTEVLNVSIFERIQIYHRSFVGSR